MVGLILTYILLIYQTRDSKDDLGKLVKVDMLIKKNQEVELLDIMNIIGRNASSTIR